MKIFFLAFVFCFVASAKGQQLHAVTSAIHVDLKKEVGDMYPMWAWM